MNERLIGLAGSVATNVDVVSSAVVLLNGLNDRLAAALAGNDITGDITKLKADLDSDNQALAAAIAKNTPVDTSGGTTTTPPSDTGTTTPPADTPPVTTTGSDGSTPPADTPPTDTSTPPTDTTGSDTPPSSDTSSTPTSQE